MSIVTIPAAGTGFEMPADDRARFEAVTAGLCRPSAAVDDPRWVAGARSAWQELPRSYRTRVADFRRHSGGGGVLLVHGIPLGDQVPDTPGRAESVQRSATPAAAALILTTCGLGDPVSFTAEKAGALVHDVVPVRGREEMQGNAGSTDLTFHNENAFHAHRPDYVLLLCLRADHDGRASLRTACIRQVLPHLTDADHDALTRPEFATTPPPSFATGTEPVAPVRHAVLRGAPEDPDMQVDFAATAGITARARDAMARLGALMTEHATTVRLAPGDLAIVDNHVTAHGRSGFRPRYDGQDRWLQRSFAARDVRRSRDLRPRDGYVLDH